MDEDEGTSCQLCLRADETDQMIPIALPHALIPRDAPTLICRECIAAVLVGSRKVMETENPTAAEDTADGVTDAEIVEDE